jgi:hydroxymethylpyrimidine/phosphomethylpyrimidine kinase
VLSGLKIETVADMAAAAQVLLDLGVKNVVMKGGHSQEEMARDYVFLADGRRFNMATPRIDTPNTHGTGCTFSAALTAFIHLGIVHDLYLGHGHGPTNHFAYQQQKGECEVDCVWA